MRENREQRREKREERGEERRGEERREGRAEERGQTREERGERRGREDRKERRGEMMTPDLSFLSDVACGLFVSLRCTCHVSAFGFVDPIRFGKGLECTTPKGTK